MFLGIIGGSFEDETRPEREQIHTATPRRRRIASYCLYYGAVSYTATDWKEKLMTPTVKSALEQEFEDACMSDVQECHFILDVDRRDHLTILRPLPDEGLPV